MRAALAYRPLRGPLQAAGAAPALAFTWSFALAAFVAASPLVMAGAGAAVAVIAWRARAMPALRAALRWGLPLGVLLVAVNGLVTHRGDTVLARLGTWPLLGQVDVTLESLSEGAVLALRVVVVLAAFAVYSACVDPDRVLRLLRPLARRSALTATLVARMVPMAAADMSRLGEAAALRGPSAEPVGRGAMLRRLLAGSLDRAVDVAATLELRGYASAKRAAPRVRRSRHDRRFAIIAAIVAAGSIAARIAGVGGFDAYPALRLDTDAATVALAVALPLAASLPFLGTRTAPLRAPVRKARPAHA